MLFLRSFRCVVSIVCGACIAVVIIAEDGNSALGADAIRETVRGLLQEIDATHPDDVERNTAGNVVSLRLRQGWANDYNLTLVSRIGSLRQLALEPTRGVAPTEHGVASLARLTNLVTLHLACTGPLPVGVFRSACNLKHLRSLHLTAAYPPDHEYNSITNLQSLTELHVNYCTNFGDAQLMSITNLVNLRSLEFRATALSGQATNILSSMTALTNLVIKPSGR